MGFPSGAVTLLFTDVEDSMGLWDADREAMAEASARHNRLVREQIEAAGGRVVQDGGAKRFVRYSPTRMRCAGIWRWPASGPPAF